MKYIRILVLCFIFLLFCGCSAKGEITPQIHNISFEANIRYYNEEYQCNADIDKDGNITLTFNSPENLEGLILRVVDDKTSIEYMGLTYSPKGSSQPLGNIANIVNCVFKDIGDKKLKHSGKNIEICGKIDNKNYVMLFSPSGLPLMLNIDNSDIIVHFNNLKID